MTNDWFVNIGAPNYVVAPMVDASELAWRLLCRRHGAQLCYSPMLHSTVFVRDPKYRKDALATCNEDRPLIVQFCGNDPETMAAAAILAEPMCDAIDINLGCPQAIAKRGHYGSFLQDEWELLAEIVSKMTAAVKLPITCKVRVYEDIKKTVDYALMLQKAGCKMLTVHGRRRDQKGPLTGIASWDHIKAVREAVRIPVLANGNIQCLQDVHSCIQYTGVNGVMSAEGNLTNPAIFEGINAITWEIVEEYLDLVDSFPCPNSYVRGHLFKIFHKLLALEENNEYRNILATGQNLEDFRTVCQRLRVKYEPYHTGEKFLENDCFVRDNYDLILPPWLCQPYVRMSPNEHIKRVEYFAEVQNSENHVKRALMDSTGNAISRKKMKKMQRYMRRPVKNVIQQRPTTICENESCLNPLGGKCEYKLCKQCCRSKCYMKELDCKGHRILVYSRKQMAKNFAKLRDDQHECKGDIISNTF